MSEKLHELGLSVSGGICITIFPENSKDFINWLLVKEESITTDVYYQKYFESTVFSEFHAAKDSGVDYVNKVYGEKEAKEHMQGIFSQKSYHKVPASFKDWMLSLTS